MIFKRIYFAALIFLLFSCEKDELFNPVETIETDLINDVTFKENFGQTIPTNFFGRVLNTDEKPIAEASVTIGLQSVTTDLNGYFKINNVDVFEKFAYIKVNKEGYVNGLKTIVPNSNNSNFLKITLIERSITGKVNSGQPSSVSIGESKVEFSGYFFNSDGSSYSGEVEVMLRYLPANNVETYNLMPGMLFAQQEDNSAVGLETFGMLLVNLYSPNGEQLNISSDAPATLTFPIDTSQVAVAPDTIELWYFDEELGYWKRSGSAQKQGDKYIGTVDHFSWWNCDAPIPYANACFTVYNGTTANSLLSNYAIEIKGNDSNAIIYTGYTSDMGENCGTFPANEEVTITVYGTQDCKGKIIHQESFGPLNDGDNFDVFVESNALSTTNLKAELKDCNNLPIQNGYVLIYNEFQGFNDDITQINITNGQLDYDFAYCNDVYNVVLFDLDTNLASNVVPLEFYGDTELNLGTITSCNNPTTTYIGDVYFNSQQDLDDFGLFNYQNVAGNVTLSGGNINNLQGLSNITHITGEFIINGTAISNLTELNDNLIIDKKFLITRNNSLNNLEGIENFTLKSILSISNNNNLSDLSALSSYTTFDSGLYIQFCDSVTSMNGLENITSIGSLTITDNNNLTDLSALSKLTNVTNLTINYNNKLASLNGLTNLSSVVKLVIISNNSLTSVDGIENLESVAFGNSSGIQISNNSSLTSLAGLSGLDSVDGHLKLFNNAISSLAGLDNLTTLTGDLILENNTGLSDYCAIQNLFINGSHGGNYTVEGNANNPTKQNIIDGSCN